MGHGLDASERTSKPREVSAIARVALVTLVLASVAAVYWRGLEGELVYDDLWLVARNPTIQSLERLPEAFTQAHWDIADPAQAARVGYWRPLTSVALFAGRAFGGGDPTGFHVVSLVCHIAAVALAFLLAERVTKSTWAALATALVFGLHPVQVEAVSWISAVNDPLCGALTLAALWLFLRWRERGSQGFPIASGVYVALALLSKESAVAFFPLALALELSRTGARFDRALLRGLVPAFAAFALYWLARVAVFGDIAGGFDRVTSHLHATAVRELTLRVELIGGALGLLVAPVELNLFREVRPEIEGGDKALWLAVFALVVWLGAVALAWKRKERIALAALLVMLAAIAPAFVRIESIGRFPLSERFLYVAVFGVALLAAHLALRWLPRVPALLALGVLAIGCGVKAHARTSFWSDEVTLFRRSALASPRSMYVQWGLGRVLLEEFRRTGDLRVLMEANAAALAAQDLWSSTDASVLRTNDDILQANLVHAWAQIFCALHRPDDCALEEAEAAFVAILGKFGDSPSAHCGLGVARKLLGKFDEAESSFRRALELDPKHIESWFALAEMQLALGRHADALGSYDECVKLAPGDVEAWLQLAKAAIELELYDRARQALARVLTLAPERPAAYVQLAVLAAREGRLEKALEFAETALRLDGANGPAHLLRAKALAQLGESGRALEAFQEAVRWLQEPSSEGASAALLVDALCSVASLAIERGQGAQAIPFLERALAVAPEGPHAGVVREQLELLKSEKQ